jgi:hypothetical protein
VEGEGVSEEAFEIRVDYGDNVVPSRYKYREDKGVLSIYGFSPAWKGWRLVAIRFDRLKFRNAMAVEEYLNKELKERLMGQINAGIWNSRIKNELLVLMAISEAKVRKAEVRGSWEY